MVRFFVDQTLYRKSKKLSDEQVTCQLSHIVYRKFFSLKSTYDSIGDNRNLILIQTGGVRHKLILGGALHKLILGHFDDQHVSGHSPGAKLR